MYESFYGLTSKPFQLNPDPLFYFGSKQHQRAKAYLEYGLHQSEGFIVITGEVGAGKTTLLRGLIEHLDPTKVIAATLVSTQLDPNDILRIVCSSFGAEIQDASKSRLLISLASCLQEHHAAGRRCLLIIDEAQHLSYEALEELRMLSNFQSGPHALVQSFLVGQPEFRDVIYGPRLQQLRQRIIGSCHIGPMDVNETRGYVEHRLKCAGATDKPVFQDDAFVAIYKATGGIPRRISVMCDRLLLSGFLAENFTFGEREVMEVANEILEETSPLNLAAEGGAGGEVRGVPPAAPGAETGWFHRGDQPRPPMRTEGGGPQDDTVLQRLYRLEEAVERIETNHAATLEVMRSLMWGAPQAPAKRRKS